MHRLCRTSLRFVSLAAALLVAGCGAGTPATVSDPVSLHLSGSVFGGQQPVIGATIQLYTVGTTATGAASTALISSTVTSQAGGTFSITGDYSCSSATQVYIVARGGNSGAGANSEIAMAAALGACSSLTPSTFITINELSTIAAAYALAPFEGSTYTSIGASTATNLGTVGLPDAFGTAALLTSPTLPTGITVPTAELNTLANILASCVNSAGASSTGCSQLNSATSTTNTLDAAFYIAKHPGAKAVTGLYSLSSATAPFQPSLSSSSAPKDFTVAITYAGSAATPLSTPFGIAIDQAGNAFVTNQAGNSLVGLSALTTGFTTGITSATLSSPQGVAVDTSGALWVANPGANNVEFYASPSTLGTVANLKTVNYGAIKGFSSTANPVSIATDRNRNAYAVSPSTNTVYAMNVNTFSTTGSITNASFSSAPAVALGGTATLAVGTGAGEICTSTITGGSVTTNFGAPSCSSLSPVTSVSALSYNTSLSTVGFAGIYIFGYNPTSYYGLYAPSPSAAAAEALSSNSTSPIAPAALAFDSAGLGFIVYNNVLFEYDGMTEVSPSNVGYGTLSTPQGVAVDPSGNIWVTNGGNNTVSIFVGLAAPTLTPIAANLH